MSNKKNIDRLFQEKFKDFEVAPNDAVWNRINESLPNKKKKRRVIAIWWQIGGVAAAIALLFTVGVSVFNSDVNTTEDPVIVNTDDTFKKLELVESDKNNESIEDKKSINPKGSQEKKASRKLTSPNKLNSDAVANTFNKKEKIALPHKCSNLIIDTNNSNKVTDNAKNSENSNKTKLTNDSELKSAIKKTIEDNKTAVTDNSTPKESNSEKIDVKTTDNTKEKEEAILKDSVKGSIEDAIASQEDINEKEDINQNRWNITPKVAPVYYSSLGQGSSLGQQFNDNTKSSAIDMSYGIAGSYALSKKLKVRAGVNRVNLNQKTSDIFAFTGPEIASRGNSVEQSPGNITFNDKVHNVLLMSSETLGLSSAPEAFNSKIAGDVDQRFGFIEVPLELEYRLMDKKLGINVIGGFSTFFLNQNEIYADIDGTSTLIGEANNINNTSFSANFGLGLDYSLSKQWNINLEPQFKYQINTFNNTSGDFRPFFIGVYTGLNFKF